MKNNIFDNFIIVFDEWLYWETKEYIIHTLLLWMPETFQFSLLSQSAKP